MAKIHDNGAYVPFFSGVDRYVAPKSSQEFLRYKDEEDFRAASSKYHFTKYGWSSLLGVFIKRSGIEAFYTEYEKCIMLETYILIA